MSFYLRYELKNHLKPHGPPIKSLKCNLSDKLFVSENGLKVNMKYFHGTAPKVSYTFWGKKCIKKFRLLDHIRMHIIERCYKGEFRSKMF